MQPEQSTMSRSLATTKRNNLVGATAVVGSTDITIGALTSRRASLLDKFCCDQRSSFSVDLSNMKPKFACNIVAVGPLLLSNVDYHFVA